MNFQKFWSKEIFSLAVILIFFVIASFLSQQYSAELKNLMLLRSGIGAAVYVFLAILAEIIIPVSVVPLLPVAVALWGGFWAGFLSVLGWTIGSSCAFYLARQYGRNLVNKLLDVSNIEEIGKAIPEKHLFWSVLFIRMIFPADVLSYAVGLFTKMQWTSYIISTFLGLIPFAFLISYGAELPLEIQIIVGATAFLLVILGYKKARRQMLKWLHPKAHNESAHPNER